MNSLKKCGVAGIAFPLLFLFGIFLMMTIDSHEGNFSFMTLLVFFLSCILYAIQLYGFVILTKKTNNKTIKILSVVNFYSFLVLVFSLLLFSIMTFNSITKEGGVGQAIVGFLFLFMIFLLFAFILVFHFLIMGFIELKTKRNYPLFFYCGLIDLSIGVLLILTPIFSFVFSNIENTKGILKLFSFLPFFNILTIPLVIAFFFSYVLRIIVYFREAQKNEKG